LNKTSGLTVFGVSILLMLAPIQSPAMNRVKDWINQIRPGTFVETTASDDLSDQQTTRFSEAEIKILTDLAKREEALRRKEAEHQQRAAELKALSQRIEQKLDEIRRLTDEFEQKRQLRQEMDEKDISRMVQYYETMEPERASVFLNQMDRMTATHILMRMNPRKAAAVMELIEPNVAVEVTEMVTRFKEDRSKVALP
jgi:flagellar motility protein MotE (MotC chaperone)